MTAVCVRPSCDPEGNHPPRADHERKIIRNTLPKPGIITCVACRHRPSREWKRGARLTGVTRNGLTTVVHACTEECVEEYLFGGTGCTFEEVTV